MTDKERYCMGRAEYLADHEGTTLSDGYEKAEKEWEEQNGTPSSRLVPCD
jgi:hypothetical protein